MKKFLRFFGKHPVVLGILIMGLLLSIPFVDSMLEQLFHLALNLLGIAGIFLVARHFSRKG